MLHTKSQGHWPFGSGEDYFGRVFLPHMGSNLDHVTQTMQINLRSPILLRLRMKFSFDWPNRFGEEDL